MKPMLAHRYADKKKHLTYPCYVQPKLNGIRMLYRAGLMQSRSHGKDTPVTWAPHRLAKIRFSLLEIPDRYILDGEIYHHGWSLQQINGAAAVNRNNDTDKTNELIYNVFDVVDTEQPGLPFSQRADILTMLSTSKLTPHLSFVLTFFCPTEQYGENAFKEFKLGGYEGMMYRFADSPYGLVENCGNKENRWNCLLKRKDWLDANCKITDFEITEGEKGEKGFSMTLWFPENGRYFNAGSGLSDMEVMACEHESPVGRFARIKYEMLSDGGVPLKPTIEAIL